jgi:ribosomal protein S18 acetylase RimI-like enzyme
MIVKINQAEYQTYLSDILKLLQENYIINLPNIKEIDSLCLEKAKALKQYLSDGTALCFGYKQNTQIIGFIWAYKVFIESGFKLHIAHLVVASEFRGQGIGHRLFNALDNGFGGDSLCKGYELITSCSNKQAVQFYKKLGFSESRVFMEREKIDT